MALLATPENIYPHPISNEAMLVDKVISILHIFHYLITTNEVFISVVEWSGDHLLGVFVVF